MSTRLAVAAAAALATAVAPSVALAAPTLAPLKPCYVSVGVNPTTGASITEDVEIAGTGFTPNSLVDVRVDEVTAASSVPIDANGNLPRGTVKAPLQEQRDRPFSVTVTEQNNPAQTATVASRVTALQVSVKPERARPSSRVTFRGRGFTDSGSAVWAHYVKGSKRRRSVKLATPTGPCGTFTVKRRQFPFRPSTGNWLLQIDQQKRYSSRPQSVFVRLEIFVRRVLRTRG